MHTWTLWAAMALSIGSITPALAGNVTADSPESLVAVIQNEGYRAQLGVDNTGDPRIESMVDGTRLWIYFYGCTDNTECSSVQFSAGFDLPDGANASTMNEWNRDMRFGQAYIDDEGDPFLQMDVDMDEGGISEELFAAQLERWGRLVASFKDHIDW